MMDDQDTTTNASMNSEDQTTSEQSSDQLTSATTANNQVQSQQQDDDEERVDLGTGKPGEDDNQDQDQDQRTDEQRAADDEAEAERAKLFGAPEGDVPYEITGLPDGMEIDTKALEAITPIAKKLGLSNDGLSLIAQTYATEVLPGVGQQVIDGLNADTLAKRKEWEGEARDAIGGKVELKTLGGEKINFGGHSLAEVQKIAAKALDHVAPAGFREWLDETGLGVHPQMIAFAYQVGKDFAEERELETADHGDRGKGDANRKTGGLTPSKFYERG